MVREEKIFPNLHLKVLWNKKLININRINKMYKPYSDVINLLINTLYYTYMYVMLYELNTMLKNSSFDGFLRRWHHWEIQPHFSLKHCSLLLISWSILGFCQWNLKDFSQQDISNTIKRLLIRIFCKVLVQFFCGFG